MVAPGLTSGGISGPIPPEAYAVEYYTNGTNGSLLVNLGFGDGRTFNAAGDYTQSNCLLGYADMNYGTFYQTSPLPNPWVLGSAPVLRSSNAGANTVLTLQFVTHYDANWFVPNGYFAALRINVKERTTGTQPPVIRKPIITIPYPTPC
jgi:hypothetical protein